MAPDTSRTVPPPVIVRDEAARADLHERLLECANLGPTALTQRLASLDRAWDAERASMVTAAGLTALGVLLGAGRKVGFFALAGFATAILVQQALTGRSAFSAAARKAGLPTRTDLELERRALKALRGDFRMVAAIRAAHPNARATQALLAAET